MAEQDAEGQFAPAAVDPPIGRLVEINYNGIKRVVRLDSNGRFPAYAEAVAGDGWSNRGAFAGDAGDFMAAKRAGIGRSLENELTGPGNRRGGTSAAGDPQSAADASGL